jgi:hypothetical protein
MPTGNSDSRREQAASVASLRSLRNTYGYNREELGHRSSGAIVEHRPKLQPAIAARGLPRGTSVPPVRPSLAPLRVF